MRESGHIMLTLLSLDHLHIGSHANIFVLPRKHCYAQCIHMESSQCNELPAITHLGHVPNECFHFVISHTGCIPIEGWRIVVCQHQVWAGTKNIICKLFGLLQTWLSSLHPDCICILCKSLGP